MQGSEQNKNPGYLIMIRKLFITAALAAGITLSSSAFAQVDVARPAPATASSMAPSATSKAADKATRKADKASKKAAKQVEKKKSQEAKKIRKASRPAFQ